MTKTITLETTLEILTCSCGIAFAVPADYLNARRNDHGTFYCPNGHGRWYPDKSDLEKAHADIEKYRRLWKDEQRYAAGAVEERNTAQRQLRATKGQMTKLKKRVANGVCPCCHRSFPNLHDHMETKHPGYTQEES